eukprot:4551290-Prymnesium_polylepis.1
MPSFGTSAENCLSFRHHAAPQRSDDPSCVVVRAPLRAPPPRAAGLATLLAPLHAAPLAPPLSKLGLGLNSGKQLHLVVLHMLPQVGTQRAHPHTASRGTSRAGSAPRLKAHAWPT